jgi:hypothetical protein
MQIDASQLAMQTRTTRIFQGYKKCIEKGQKHLTIHI